MPNVPELSRRTSTQKFDSHLYKFHAANYSGSDLWRGVARVPSNWTKIDVRNALKRKYPTAYTVEPQWAPDLENQKATVTDDFAPPPAREPNFRVDLRTR